VAERDWGHGLLLDAVGSRLEAIARAHYQRQDRVDDTRGALELAFEGGRMLHLTTATNGESVRVREGPWVDPVAAPDEGTDAAWVAQHGHWIRVDAKEREGYARLVGERLGSVRWLANEHGSVAGVEMRFGAAALTFVSWGDDEYVFPGDFAAVPTEWGIRVIPSPETVMEAR
jgi:hypothetical protein